MNPVKLIPASIANVVALMAYFLGRFGPHDFGANIAVVGTLTSILFLFIAGFLSPERQRLGVFFLWGYAGLFAILDPIAFIGRASADVRVVPILLLVPYLLAAIGLARRQNWFAAVATWSFLFAAILALSYNVHHGGSGISLLAGGWIGGE